MYKLDLYTTTIPASLNQLLHKHWSYRKKERLILQNELKLHFLKTYKAEERSLIKKILPLKELETIKLYYYFPTNRRRDRNNYSGKVLLDALVRDGWITDDNTKVLKNELQPELLYVKGMKGVHIQIYHKGE